MLGSEYEAFLESYTKPRTFGLRLNTAKISAGEFEKIVPFPVTPIPWVKNAYFYPADVRPSRCPLYQAGLYYLQEPSAMTPASCLPAEPGDVVLDLCAAPGGKATALGAALNERAQKQEHQRLQSPSSSEESGALRRHQFPHCKRDAGKAFGLPGVFWQDPSGRPLLRGGDVPQGRGPKKWTPEKSRELSQIQRELILQAADMLRPGGLLLYSTCTFAPTNEGVVSWLLEKRPDMKLLEIPQHNSHPESPNGGTIWKA